MLNASHTPWFASDALVGLSIAILILTAAYLAGLGATVLARPDAARRFFSRFAQTHRANLIEAGLRLVVGMAFVGASSRTQAPNVAIGVGLLLVVTAALMALLPGLHRRFSAKATASLIRFYPLFGIASLILAALLAWFIS